MMLAATGNSERRRAIDITAEIRSYREFILSLLESRGVEMEMVCPSAGVYRTEMRPENFYCLLQILTANSLDWLRGAVDPRIRITITGLPDGCEIIFSDTGPGVAPEISHCIFNPLFSCKEGGRGMGLTIARQLVEAHGGRIHLILDGRRRGANFRIVLPRKRSRATIYDR
jgi:C4-dicarboxylate-specific signal transduction histidine kinase